jgi:LysM repeat protein
MRDMYDSLNPAALPDLPGTLVASYIDGGNAPAPGWESRFQHAKVVRIARISTTNAGDVGDVESTDLTPADSVDWVILRRSAGATPTLYCNESTWPSVKQAFAARGVAEPEWWIAAWDGNTAIPAGAVAHQYANSAMTGQDYDASSVEDTWPGVDTEPAPPVPPEPPEATYTVQKGDTLWSIAQAHGMTLAEIEALNPQAGHPPGDFSMIWPGDTLKVAATPGQPTPAPPPPAPAIYTVVRGDSMWSIAQAHGMTLAELEQLNPHAGHPQGDFSMIWPGDQLFVR